MTLNKKVHFLPGLVAIMITEVTKGQALKYPLITLATDLNGSTEE